MYNNFGTFDIVFHSLSKNHFPGKVFSGYLKKKGIYELYEFLLQLIFSESLRRHESEFWKTQISSDKIPVKFLGCKEQLFFSQVSEQTFEISTLHDSLKESQTELLQRSQVCDELDQALKDRTWELEQRVTQVTDCIAMKKNIVKYLLNIRTLNKKP